MRRGVSDECRVERAEKKMKKTITVLTLCAMLFALSYFASAQQPTKVTRIGYLSPNDPTSDSSRSEPIRLALRQLGYIEGQNIAFEYRYAEGKVDRFPELAAELVRILRRLNPTRRDRCVVQFNLTSNLAFSPSTKRCCHLPQYVSQLPRP